MKDRFLRLHLLLVGSAIGFGLLVFLLFVYINAGYFRFHFLSDFIRRESWLVFIPTTAMFYFLYYSMQFFDARFRDTPNSFKRFICEVLVVLGVGILIGEALRQMLIWSFGAPTGEEVMITKNLRQLLMIDVTLLSAVYGYLTSLRIFRYFQQKQVELHRMQRDLAQSQFETLKNKLNPHFLFNSLSTLSSLVYSDSTKAELFVEKLSKTYRYILEQKDERTVPLEKELTFLAHYLFLLNQQFGHKLAIHVLEHNSSTNHHLPPHAIMIVLEYIIHHHTMSARNPLVINIDIDTGYVSFTWPLQPKEPGQVSITEQLEQLSAQYIYLGSRQLIRETSQHQSLIQLPLLPPMKP